jgi:hypothetical protein
VGTDPAEVPDAVKRERLLVLCRASGLLDAALAREVGVFDANTVWAGDGKRTTASWVASRSEVSPTHARAVVRAAKQVRSCPVVDQAWRTGRIGTAKVTALLRAREVHPELFATCEAELVEEVEPLTVPKAEQHLARWAAVAEATRDAERAEDAGEDPDSAAEPDPMADNALHLSQTFGGRWVSDASFDPVTGAEIHDAIAAEIDARFHAGVYRADDGMTPAQRRSECAHALITRGANPAQTRHGEARPSVSVEIDARPSPACPSPTPPTPPPAAASSPTAPRSPAPRSSGCCAPAGSPPSPPSSPSAARSRSSASPTGSEMPPPRSARR